MTDAPKVVGLRGQQVVDPRQPLKAVIDIAEEIADLARTGEIKGLAVVCAYFDDGSRGLAAGELSYSMVGRIEQIKGNILEALKK
jgi:hypothetical protein